MDDKDKNLIEQIVDTVNDFVESFANTAAEALDQAMEPSPVKLDEQPISDNATYGNDDGLGSPGNTSLSSPIPVTTSR